MKNLFLALFILAMPALANAQCHHFSGSHMHFSGHSSGFHYHPSHCYRYHFGGRASAGQREVDPMKKVSEIAGSVGELSNIQSTDQTLTSATPIYSATYKYFLTDRFAVGVSASSQALAGKDTCHCITPMGTTSSIYNYKANNLVFAANITWIYSNHNAIETYGELSGGMSILRERDSYQGEALSSATFNKPTVQVTPFGIRMGRDFGGFLEIGYGYKGIVCGGLSYQMGREKAPKHYYHKPKLS